MFVAPEFSGGELMLPFHNVAAKGIRLYKFEGNVMLLTMEV